MAGKVTRPTGPAVPWYPPLGEPVTALPAENLDAGSGFSCCGLNLLFGDFRESFLDKLGRPGHGIGVDLDPLERQQHITAQRSPGSWTAGQA
jgi:hypothetical protein